MAYLCIKNSRYECDGCGYCGQWMAREPEDCEECRFYDDEEDICKLDREEFPEPCRDHEFRE